MRFKDLQIGQRFEFTSVREFPFSGMERGPWTKTSARKYEKAWMRCEVGSVNAEVDLLEDRPTQVEP